MKIIFCSLLVVTFLSTSVFANNSDDSVWTLRTGIALVSPNDDSGTVLNGGVGVDSSLGLGFSFAYQIDDSWAVEVLASLPFSHDIQGTGVLQGLDVGETKHLPPTVSVLYHWGDETQFHVGAGLNYTLFFEEKSSAELDTALAADTELQLEDSLGVALKFGFDTPMTDDWNFSGSLYYITIDTTADIIIADAVAASVDVDIDPWVVMLGVSTSF
jgi:outer membrane protein